jgi:hypothetical protein
MTLTWASKGNTGDPERQTQNSGPETSVKEDEVSQKEGIMSFQEVGLSHSSDEVP